MNNITDLVQVAQQAHREYMGWHEGEHRLLTCISTTRIDEIKQDIQRGRELRRAAIAQETRTKKSIASCLLISRHLRVSWLTWRSLPKS